MKWTDRVFDFQSSVKESTRLLQRLRSTPDRLEALVSLIPRQVLVRRDGNSWSIQENAGHLMDLESLFLGRLDDYAADCETLRPADMTNRKTYSARHNESDTGTILTEFRRQRNELVERLEKFKPDELGKSAIHPRLRKPMRICDMMYFQAEHDDHHLARIRELLKRFKSQGGPGRTGRVR